MDLVYIIKWLFFNKRYLSSFIKSALLCCLIIYNFKKYKILKKILELLYFPIIIITTYNVLFTLGELFNWQIFKGYGYFGLLYGLSTIIKIILLIILLSHKISFKFISVILTLLLWVIFAKITNLKGYEANKLEYLLIFLISLLFCLLINNN